MESVMTTTAFAEPSTEANRTVATTADVCAELHRLAEQSRTGSAFYQQAFRIVAEHFQSPFAILRVARSARTLDERFQQDDRASQQWEAVTEAALLQCQTHAMPVARLYAVDGTSMQVVVLAVPVCDPAGRAEGAMSLVAACQSPALVNSHLTELQSLVAVMGVRAGLIGSAAGAQTVSGQAEHKALAKSAGFESLHEMAFAVTNSLKTKFACDQVVLGLVKGRHVRVLAISGLDDVCEKSPGVKHIRQAMHECLDSGQTICCQAEGTWTDDLGTSNHRLHRDWHHAIGDSPVASIPLYCENRCVAVVSLVRNKQSRFTKEELAKIDETVSPFAPALLLVARATRGLAGHAISSVDSRVRWLLAPRTYRRKLVAAALAACVAALFVVSIDYEVTVPSRIAPTEVRYFASPFQATIAACHVEVGDRVTKGQLLYELDTADLELQQDRLRSEVEILKLQARQAMAVKDVRAAALANSELQGTQAELALVQHNLSRAAVCAPSAGTIVAGDLKKRIGEVVPMGDSLLEFVPRGNWSIELHIPEALATDLDRGLTGRFASNARPEDPLPCRIDRIRPSSETIEGENVFVGEARVEDNPAWMRSGMEGIARIEAGRRPLWWIAMHRVVDYLRLRFWV